MIDSIVTICLIPTGASPALFFFTAHREQVTQLASLLPLGRCGSTCDPSPEHQTHPEHLVEDAQVPAILLGSSSK